MTLRTVAAVLMLVGNALAGVLQDVDELERQLRSSNEKERRKAVQGLAALGTDEAWELVLEGLGDPSPQVADESQLQLPKLFDAARFDDLFGRKGLTARDEWVRLRVAQILGVSPIAVPGAELVKPLGDKDAHVRTALARSIEQLVVAGRLDGSRDELTARLARLAQKDKDATVRATAWLTTVVLARGTEAAVDAATLRTQLEQKAYELRAAAMIAAAELDPDERIELARLAMADAHIGVRTLAVEVLVELATPQASLALVDALEAEPSVRLRWTIVDELQGLSGLSHRLDPRPWRAWAQGLAEDWQPAQEKKNAKPEADRATAAFAGMPILSERVVFLIDFSGSMWKQRRDGKTRKQVVDAELRRALEAMSGTVEFNVIPYTDRPLPWQQALVPATKRNVKEALDEFESSRAQGVGNFWDAALLALTDPNVDTLMVLTDGAPTGGHRWNMNLIQDLFAEQNRFRRVAVQAVLVECPNHLKARWAELCEASHGSSLATRLN